MGSGLILLVIVAAWLAVLVPMALRSHDSGASLGSVDRFNDAMRVLSRRDGGEPDVPAEPLPRERGALARLAWPRPGLDRPARAPRSAAARRRRLLVLLLALSAGTLVGGLLGPSLLLGVHAVVDVALVAFVVGLRRLARRRREAGRREAGRGDVGRREAGRAPGRAGAAPRRAPQPQDRPAPERPLRRPAHVAGVPDRMPPRPAPLAAPLPLPARRYEDPLPAAALGEPWSPVPVPVPTYVTAPMAPPRPPRVLDLTRPGEWSEQGLSEAEREIGIVDDGPALEEILDRRRAVNDW